MSNGAQSAAGVAMYRTVRELGSRSPRSYAAIREPNELVVTYRYARAADAMVSSNVATYVNGDGAIALGSEALASLQRDATCLEKNWHPNIARVRHVDLTESELTVSTELVDGATLEDLFAVAAARRTPGAASTNGEPFLPLPVVVRIVVDVLAGLHGLHGLRDPARGTLGVIHGALCPANIVVGKDGVARIINTLRARPVQIGPGSEAVGYGAPEALDVGGTSDPRSDVHSVGVILWEALTGRRLYDEKDPVRVLARQREEEIEPPSFSAGSPFAALDEVVLHALAFDPSLRFKSAAEMGSALRTIAGARIATGSVVAAQVAELAGDRIRARRIELDPSSSGTRRRASLGSMKAAKPAAEPAPGAAAASAATPWPNEASSSGPMSRRATVPPAALELELEREEAAPASLREELSLRDMMAAAPPLHESTMVKAAEPSTPDVVVPPAAPVPAIALAPTPTPAPAAPTANAVPRAGSVPRVAAAPRAIGVQRPATPPAAAAPAPTRSVPAKPPPPVSRRPPPPAPAPVVVVVVAPASHPNPVVEDAAVHVAPAIAPPIERTSSSDRTFAPVTDPTHSSPPPYLRADVDSSPPPPPIRKTSPAVLGGALVLALLGAGLALRAIFSDPTPPATTTAANVRPSAEVPSTAITAPPPSTAEPANTNANAEAKAKTEADAKASAEAEAKAKTETEAKARDEASAKTAEPTAPTTPRVLPPPRPTGPTAPRPKKPYEPSGI